MSKVLIDRELLSVASLHLEYSSYTETGKKLRALLDTPSGTPAMPVKAYYHEAPNEYGGFNKSVGLEVRKAFIDAPLVLEADALMRIACLEGEIAKRDARIVELHNDASYYAARNEELRAELAAIKAQEPVAWVGAIEDGVPLLVAEPENWKATPLYAAPVSEAKRSAAEMFSDVLMCQRNQVETLAGDPYMVGLYNGMSMMIANFDDSPDFERLSVSEAKAQGVVMPERASAIHGSHDHQSGWNACLDEVARLNAAPIQRVSVPDDEAVMAKARELFGWAYDLGCFPDAVRDLVAFAHPAAPADDAGLVEALEQAKEWLEGWASAEPQLAVINQALAAHRAKEVV